MPNVGMPMPIPSAAPAAASAAQMSASPPLPASPYPYQTVPPTPVEREISGAGRRGLPRIITTLFIIIVCLFVGGGIYYFVNQAGTPSPSNGTADITPPSIQSVSPSSITETGATISWETDEPATGQFEYGKTETYGLTAPPDTNLSTSHSVTLTGLDPNTTYYFKVISNDAAGNEITAKGELTTLATADETPPTISGVGVSNITESSATITWVTNEPATSQVQYGKTETYGSSTTPDTNLTNSHNITLTGLSDNTTYYFKVISKDASENEATLAAENQKFTTESVIPVGYEEGDLAPDFTLKDLNDNNVNLKDFRGKIVIVNFWATWCGPCMNELPFFQAISDNESAGGFKILAINQKETKNQVLSKFTDEGYTFTFTILLDSDGKITEKYGFVPQVTPIPKTFFIDAEGIIQEIQEGDFSSQDEIEDILDSL
jgi:peroxiredoxin